MQNSTREFVELDKMNIQQLSDYALELEILKFEIKREILLKKAQIKGIEARLVRINLIRFELKNK